MRGYQNDLGGRGDVLLMQCPQKNDAHLLSPHGGLIVKRKVHHERHEKRNTKARSEPVGRKRHAPHGVAFAAVPVSLITEGWQGRNGRDTR